MLQDDNLHYADLENSGEALIRLIESSNAGDDLRVARIKQQELFDHHAETKKTVAQLLNGK